MNKKVEEVLSNSAIRKIAAAQKIKDPVLREKKIKDARKLSYDGQKIYKANLAKVEAP